MLYAVILAALVNSPPVRSPVDSIRSEDDVRQVALRHAAEIKECYEAHGLKVNPALRGTLEVELRVLPTGRVDSAAVSRSQLAGLGKEAVEACVVGAVRNWRFDRGNYAPESIVYPFQLQRDRTDRATPGAYSLTRRTAPADILAE